MLPDNCGHSRYFELHIARMKNNKAAAAAELEAELIRLNTLVRARRKQLAQLQRCPNKDCECRLVWGQVVEKTLSRQMGRIRRHVKRKPGSAKAAKRGAAGP